MQSLLSFLLLQATTSKEDCVWISTSVGTMLLGWEINRASLDWYESHTVINASLLLHKHSQNWGSPAQYQRATLCTAHCYFSLLLTSSSAPYSLPHIIAPRCSLHMSRLQSQQLHPLCPQIPHLATTSRCPSSPPSPAGPWSLSPPSDAPCSPSPAMQSAVQLHSHQPASTHVGDHFLATINHILQKKQSLNAGKSFHSQIMWKT